MQRKSQSKHHPLFQSTPDGVSVVGAQKGRNYCTSTGRVLMGTVQTEYGVETEPEQWRELNIWEGDVQKKKSPKEASFCTESLVFQIVLDLPKLAHLLLNYYLRKVNIK